MTDYDFRTLSPYDFEEFVRDLLTAHEGRLYASYGKGPDKGIDLLATDRATGKLTVVQCKHRPDISGSGLTRIVEKETKDLNWSQQPDRYLLATSAAISPQAEEKLCITLSYLPIVGENILHRGRLNSLLATHSEVERRHFKLWLASSNVLERIMTTGEWVRSEELLQRITDRIRLYVTTPAYERALRRIEQENYVTLTGPPGVGKSTTAEMLLLSMWHEGWTIVDVTANIEEAWNQLRTPDKNRVFYYDDFLGQTDTAELGKNESGSISNFIDAIRRGDGSRRLVMTTRDQVLAQALNGVDDRLRRMPIDASRIQVKLEKMTRFQRAHLLFNHLHFSLNSVADRNFAADNLSQVLKIIDHPNFSPRIIETATMRTSFNSASHLFSKLLESLSNPDEVWAGSFSSLSLLSTSVLGQLVMLPGQEVSLKTMYCALGRPESRAWRDCIHILEGTWVRIVDGEHYGPRVTLFDGSRRDFLLSRLRDIAVVEELLEQAKWIEQVSYLARLGGLNSPITARADASEAVRAMRQNLRTASKDIGQAARRVADAEIESWQLVNYKPSSSPSGTYERYSHSRFADIVTATSPLLQLVTDDFT